MGSYDNDTISFNKGNLEEVGNGLSTCKNQMNVCLNTIEEQVKIIRDNWSGEEFEKAKVNLDKIEKNLNAVRNYLTSVSDAYNQVSTNFAGVNYRG